MAITLRTKSLKVRGVFVMTDFSDFGKPDLPFAGVLQTVHCEDMSDGIVHPLATDAVKRKFKTGVPLLLSIFPHLFSIQMRPPLAKHSLQGIAISPLEDEVGYLACVLTSAFLDTNA